MSIVTFVVPAAFVSSGKSVAGGRAVHAPTKIPRISSEERACLDIFSP
jgi:hypothetical protein